MYVWDETSSMSRTEQSPFTLKTVVTFLKIISCLLSLRKFGKLENTLNLTSPLKPALT